jgi:hypothetical protein
MVGAGYSEDRWARLAHHDSSSLGGDNASELPNNERAALTGNVRKWRSRVHEGVPLLGLNRLPSHRVQQYAVSRGLVASREWQLERQKERDGA